MISHLSTLLLLFAMSQSSTEMSRTSKLLGFRISKYSSFFPFSCSGDMLIPELSEGTEVTIRIVGHLADVNEAALTASNQDCASVYPETIVPIEKESDEVGSITLTTPSNLPKQKTIVHYCFRAGEEHGWIHQGSGYWAKLIIVQQYATVYVIIFGCILCTLLATILNTSLLGLIYVDKTALRAKAASGSEQETIVSRAILGFRKRGRLITMAIIIFIVLFKTLVTVLLRMISRGWLAVILSTAIITLIIEMIPQARRRLGKNTKSWEMIPESSITFKYKEENVQ